MDPSPLKRFARRHPRVSIAQHAALRTPSGAVAGEIIDLSVGGAAIVLPARVAKGTASTLWMDGDHPGERPAPAPCVVRSVTASRSGAGVFRLGVAFTSDATKREHVRSDRARQLSDLGDHRPIAVTPEGREALFQLALQRLDEGHFDAARRFAISALRGDPRNPHYSGLVHLINGRAAAQAETLPAARHELACARLLVPEDPLVLALDRTVRDLEQRATFAPSPLRRMVARVFGSARPG